jgi:cyanophycinase
MRVKGKILLVGGGEYRGPHPDDREERKEDTDHKEEFTPLKHLCPDPERARIEIITSGTAYPRESFERYENYFRSQGVKEIAMLDIDSRHIKEEQIKRVEDATAIFFSGGNQRKILELILDTEIHNILLKRYEKDADFIVGGTSAGTMALTELTIGDGFEKSKLLKGDVDIRKGMNLLPGVITDTHFLESMRLSRLTLALLENKDFLGIALSENSGALVTDGDLIEPAGDEMVLLLDASDIEESNFNDAKRDEPVFAMGMKLHFLSPGAVYSIKERRLV